MMHIPKRRVIGRRLGKKLSGSVILLFSLLAGSRLFATDRVEFSIVARVKFAVPADWKVISSKSDAEITVFAFQIPNPADEGTPDSTNLALIASHLKDPAATSAFEKKASHREPNTKDRKLVDKWSCTSFSGEQGATTYEAWDCYRIVGECGVHVRIAWPHLPKNPPDYDNGMEAALEDVLKSVAPSPNVPPAGSEKPHP